jgi:hypothetical protein
MPVAARGRAITFTLLVVTLLGTALVARARIVAPAAIEDLPSAPTASYAPAGAAPHVNLDVAVQKIGLDVVDSYTAWRQFERQVTTGLEHDRLNLPQLRASIRVGIRAARYVLLTDSSPVLPIGAWTKLPPLYRRPVWLVPTYGGQNVVSEGERDYLVLDGTTGQLLEHLTIVPLNPLASCATAAPALLYIGPMACMLRHMGDARGIAYRSVP